MLAPQSLSPLTLKLYRAAAPGSSKASVQPERFSGEVSRDSKNSKAKRALHEPISSSGDQALAVVPGT